MKFIPTILPLLLVASTTADLNTRSDRKLGGGVGGKSNFPPSLSSAGTRMAMADEEVDVDDVDVAELKKQKGGSCAGTYPSVLIEQWALAFTIMFHLLPVLFGIGSIDGGSEELGDPPSDFQLDEFASIAALFGDDFSNFPSFGYIVGYIAYIYGEMSCEEYEKEEQYTNLLDFADYITNPFGLGSIQMDIMGLGNNTGFFNYTFTHGDSSKNSTPTPETEDSEEANIAGSQKDEKYGSGSCAKNYPLVAIEQVFHSKAMSHVFLYVVTGILGEWPDDNGQPAAMYFPGELFSGMTFDSFFELAKAMNSVYAEMSCEEYVQEKQVSSIIKLINNMAGSGDMGLIEFLQIVPPFASPI